MPKGLCARDHLVRLVIKELRILPRVNGMLVPPVSFLPSPPRKEGLVHTVHVCARFIRKISVNLKYSETVHHHVAILIFERTASFVDISNVEFFVSDQSASFRCLHSKLGCQ